MNKLRKSLTALSLAGVLGSGLALASAGPAQAAWQCSVPPGMTYDWVTWSSQCGITGTYYNVIAPADGVWACRVPVGWNWTATKPTTLCTTDGRQANFYQLVRAS